MNQLKIMLIALFAMTGVSAHAQIPVPDTRLSIADFSCVHFGPLSSHTRPPTLYTIQVFLKKSKAYVIPVVKTGTVIPYVIQPKAFAGESTDPVEYSCKNVSTVGNKYSYEIKIRKNEMVIFQSAVNARFAPLAYVVAQPKTPPKAGE